MRKHSDPLNTPSMEAHWRCVQHLHSCVFALLYSALAHHPPSPQHPKTRCQSPCDAPRQRGFDRSKTFKSLPLSSTAARFNALYQKRPPCSFRASSREVLSAGRFRYNSLHFELLAVPVAEPANEPAGTNSTQQHRCPLCRQGRMLLVETFEPPQPAAFLFFDTS